MIQSIKKYFDKTILSSDIGLNNQSNRDIWLKNTLLKIPSGSRILDAGAGELKYKEYCSHLNYVSQDFAQYDGKGDNSGLQTQSWDNSKLDIISDITSIPELDCSFDAIMCIEVLEHVPDPVSALKELSRLLKKNGHLILTAPFCSLTHFAPYHFSTGFNKYFYQKILTENGFEIIDIESNGNYFEYIAQELRRLPEISLRYSAIRLTLFNRLMLRIMLKILDKMNKKDKASKELLCYGYHVFARKTI